MRQTSKKYNTGEHTKYKDINNNTIKVKHSTVLTGTERREIEEKIVDELYKIFTHKAG